MTVPLRSQVCRFHVGCAEPLSRDLPAHQITVLLMEGLLLRSAGALSARVSPTSASCSRGRPGRGTRGARPRCRRACWRPHDAAAPAPLLTRPSLDLPAGEQSPVPQTVLPHRRLADRRPCDSQFHVRGPV